MHKYETGPGINSAPFEAIGEVSLLNALVMLVYSSYEGSQC